MEQQIKLAGIFGNGMVLQRSQTNRIWGTDPKAEKVYLEIDGYREEALVSDTKFSFLLPPHESASGLNLKIEGTGTIVLEDICYGDVFLLSGQSNMELPIARVLDESAEEVAMANDPLIRQYRLTPDYVFGEGQVASLPDLPWIKAVPGEIMEISAVGYFFAARIRKEVDVPIGLILNAQGGASIEAWMPMERLQVFGDPTGEIVPFQEEGSLEAFLKDREVRISKWYQEIDSGKDAEYGAGIPADARSIRVPGVFAELDGLPFTGSAWFYRSIVLEKEPTGEALLYAGELIDSDRTYINGQQVGETGYRYPPRKYFFNAAALRKGSNLIAIRLVIENGFGGFIPEHPYYLSVGDEKVDLTGEWSYVIEKRAIHQAVEGFLAQKIPTGLFRASIMTLKGLSLKGALWYQGESNAGEPDRYLEKFDAMVASWRDELEQELPILAVEMADYLDPQGASNDGWASIQEQQRRSGERTVLCDVASAKDLGAPYELHPQKKKELGERLADKGSRLFY